MKKILLILMAMFAFGLQNVSAQDGIKIITNHPDFKIKVKRCAASGKTVVIDLILTNEGTNDIEGVYVCGGAWDCSEAYDDECLLFFSLPLECKLPEGKAFSPVCSVLYS